MVWLESVKKSVKANDEKKCVIDEETRKKKRKG